MNLYISHINPSIHIYCIHIMYIHIDIYTYISTSYINPSILDLFNHCPSQHLTYNKKRFYTRGTLGSIRIFLLAKIPTLYCD